MVPDLLLAGGGLGRPNIAAQLQEGEQQHRRRGEGKGLECVRDGPAELDADFPTWTGGSFMEQSHLTGVERAWMRVLAPALSSLFSG